MGTNSQQGTVLNGVLELLREAGLDEFVTNIQVLTNEDGTRTYRIDHTGNDDDEAAINTAFHIVMDQRAGHN